MSSSTLNASDELDQIFNTYQDTFEFDAWVESDSTNALKNMDDESYYYSTDLVDIEPSHNQFCTVFVDYEDADSIQPNSRCTVCQTEIGIQDSDSTSCLKCRSVETSKQSFKEQVRNSRARKINNSNQRDKKNAADVNVKPYQCKYCDEYFGSISSLLDHVKIHSDIRCETCGSAFYSSLELRDHAKTHNGAQPIANKRIRTSFESTQSRKCKISNESDAQKTSEMSISNIEKNCLSKGKSVEMDKMFRCCKMCGKVYSRTSLHICMQGVDGLPGEEIFEVEDSDSSEEFGEMFLGESEPAAAKYKCNYCNKVFNQMFVLNSHIMTHNMCCRFQCKFCDQRFEKSYLLLRHVENVHKLVQ